MATSALVRVSKEKGMNQTKHITPPRKWSVIVAGPIDAAATNLDRYVDHRPFADVRYNGYGAIHATVYAEQAELSAWFMATNERVNINPDQPNGEPIPGALLFYMGE